MQGELLSSGENLTCPQCKGSNKIQGAFDDAKVLFVQNPMVTPLLDPTKATALIGPRKIKALLTWQAFCADCGNVWIRKWEIREALGQVNVSGPAIPPGLKAQK